jgi:hypothetical protein
MAGKKRWSTLKYLKGRRGPEVPVEIADHQDRRGKLDLKDRKVTQEFLEPKA